MLDGSIILFLNRFIDMVVSISDYSYFILSVLFIGYLRKAENTMLLMLKKIVGNIGSPSTGAFTRFPGLG